MDVISLDFHVEGKFWANQKYRSHITFVLEGVCGGGVSNISCWSRRLSLSVWMCATVFSCRNEGNDIHFLDFTIDMCFLTRDITQTLLPSQREKMVPDDRQSTHNTTVCDTSFSGCACVHRLIFCKKWGKWFPFPSVFAGGASFRDVCGTHNTFLVTPMMPLDFHHLPLIWDLKNPPALFATKAKGARAGVCWLSVAHWVCGCVCAYFHVEMREMVSISLIFTRQGVLFLVRGGWCRVVKVLLLQDHSFARMRPRHIQSIKVTQLQQV